MENIKLHIMNQLFEFGRSVERVLATSHKTKIDVTGCPELMAALPVLFFFIILALAFNTAGVFNNGIPKQK